MEDRTGDANTSWQVFQQRTLHAASQECSGSKPAVRRCQLVADMAAASTGAPPSRPRKKKRVSARMRRLQADLEKMSPEEREDFFATIWMKRLRDYPERYEGKVVRRKPRSVLEAQANEKILASGRPLEPQIRNEPRWKINQRLDLYKIRPGAHKMVLPPEEEEKLQLDMFGEGVQLSPTWPWGFRLGGRGDFVFGVFGRSERARAVLEREWAGRDPEAVIWDEDFYEDIIDNAHNIELTLMVKTLRPLKLAPLRRALGYRLDLAMRGLPIKGKENKSRETLLVEEPLDEADTAALKEFQATFDEARLATSDPGRQWVDKRGHIKEDTHLIFNVSPNFELHGEVITPGNLRDRKAYTLGVWRSRRLARAAFDLFLGEFPVDARAKYQAGQAVLYVTNGFKLGPNPTNPNQVLIDEDGIPLDALPGAAPMSLPAGEGAGKESKPKPAPALGAGKESKPKPAPALASLGSSWAFGGARPLLDGLRRRFGGRGA